MWTLICGALGQSTESEPIAGARTECGDGGRNDAGHKHTHTDTHAHTQTCTHACADLNMLVTLKGIGSVYASHRIARAPHRFMIA